MDRFGKLMTVVLVSGTLAGLLLFLVQRFTVFPLIEKAEVFETAAEHAKPESHQHDHKEWQPRDGLERTLFTVLTTVLSSIGFAALLFGIAALEPASLNWKYGALWGFAAFACVDLAPALGLPPQPPGAAVADLNARQLWWVATVVASAIGLWMLVRWKRTTIVRLVGVAVLTLPHIVGAPGSVAEGSVPVSLARQFALTSILTTGIFWLSLGSIGGLLHERLGYGKAGSN